MSIREDVFELLRLYEGPNPRFAFKFSEVDHRPRDHNDNAWITEDPECGQWLVFRSQVPDDLEPAFDIAIGEGLLEQHILTPDQQLSLYESYGMRLPKQEMPWKVYPANIDAIVCITEIGRAAIASFGESEKSEIGGGWLSVSNLAEKYNVDVTKLRKRLDTWRMDHDTGYCEVTSRKPRDPKYLYDESAVMPVIDSLRLGGERASKKR